MGTGSSSNHDVRFSYHLRVPYRSFRDRNAILCKLLDHHLDDLPDVFECLLSGLPPRRSAVLVERGTVGKPPTVIFFDDNPEGVFFHNDLVEMRGGPNTEKARTEAFLQRSATSGPESSTIKARQTPAHAQSEATRSGKNLGLDRTTQEQMDEKADPKKGRDSQYLVVGANGWHDGTEVGGELFVCQRVAWRIFLVAFWGCIS